MSLAARAALVLTGALALRGILPPQEWPWLPVALLALLAVAASMLAALRHRHEADGGPARRDPAFYVLLAALGLLLAILFSHRMRIVSDGLDHYVYLRSLWFDHDLDLANDYEALAPGAHRTDPLTPIGRAGNQHPVGPAIVWSPLFAVADLVSRATGHPPGENALHRNAVAIASLVYGWLGLWLVYLAARPRAGRGAALLAALGLGFGTFLYWYLAFAPTMSHAPAFAAAALVSWLWLRPAPQGPRRALLLGAACGLAALLRWANGLLLVLPAAELLRRLLRREQRRGAVRDAALLAAAALLVFSPQLIVWKQLYGSFLTIPQGSAFLAGAPAIGGVLFSPRKGLFAWSPLLYAGLAGLLPLGRREPWRAVAMVAFLGALTRVNAGVADWWGGAAFGGRRFDAALPLLGLGLALALAGLARWAQRRPLAVPAGLVAAFVLWNVALARQYRAGAWDYSDPVTFEEMGRGAVAQVDRALGSPFALPASLWEWLRTGRPPADYESLFAGRPYSRWSIRMGVDERLFLEDGWSETLREEGAECRRLTGESAGLVVPLHRPAAYRLGARVRAAGAARVRALVNQRPVGEWAVGKGWSDYTTDVAPELLRAGRNFLRFRVVAGEAPVFAGVWMEPITPRGN